MDYLEQAIQSIRGGEKECLNTLLSRMQPSILELPSQHSKTITMVDTGLKTTTRENSFPRLITGIFQSALELATKGNSSASILTVGYNDAQYKPPRKRLFTLQSKIIWRTEDVPSGDKKVAAFLSCPCLDRL